MGVMRKLTGLLIEDLSIEEKEEETLAVLKRANVKVAPPEADKPNQTLVERWDQSRFGRPEWIRILDNIDQLIEILPEYRRRTGKDPLPVRVPVSGLP
jgi:hypothetical protein